VSSHDVAEPGSTSESELPPLSGLMQLTTGLWASQTLAAAEGLDLFTFLSGGPGATVAEVAAEVGIAGRPAEIVLTACAALGLLTRDGDRYRNSPTAEEYLVRGKQYYFGDYVRMQREYGYPGWMRVSDAIKANAPSRVTSNEQDGIFEAGTRPRVFWDGLYPLSALTARVLAASVDFGAATSLLDVGGGNAAFAVELCRRYPDLRVTVFDLPFVCDYTAGRISEEKLSDRVSLCPGDFFQDQELPGEHDTILLSMILHDWDEPRNAEILAKCFRALPGGGQLVISELLVDDEKTGPVDAALMSMNMLVGTWGRNYTVAEYQEWLAAAGFDDIRTVRFDAPGANGAVIARKP
jgi:ubiquinone/menaquinone biosynthesis C-methylase UbiE